MEGAPCTLFSPSLPVSTHMYTRAPPFTRFSPTRSLLSSTFSISARAPRLPTSVQIPRFSCLSSSDDPIAREFARRTIINGTGTIGKSWRRFVTERTKLLFSIVPL